jgi:hypothetical protein
MVKVTNIKILDGYLLELTFSDGIIKVVDLRPYLGKGISRPLLDRAYFQQVMLESGGGICWSNGYDFCPNFLHDEVPAAVPSAELNG